MRTGGGRPSASRSGSCCVRARRRGPAAPGTTSAPSDRGDSSQRRRVGTADAVGEHDVERELGRVAGRAPRGGSPARSPSVSPGCGGEVEHDAAGGPCVLRSARGEVGHQQVRDHAGEPRARAEHHPVGRRGPRRPPRRRPAGRSRHAARRSTHPAGGRRDRHLAADLAIRAGPARRVDLDDAPRCPAAPTDIGSTRPCAPSSRATQSSPATESPSSSHSATISRLPTAWSCRSPSLRKRCCTTRLQVWPHSSSPHSAASAIRRSPGGSTPSSRRSRPLDPPSSATVTTAVRRSVTRRSADSDAARPCPPPSATTAGPRPPHALPDGPCSLAPEVAVDDRGVDAGVGQPPRAAPRPSRPSGACRRCSRRRSSRTACPRAGSRRR